MGLFKSIAKTATRALEVADQWANRIDHVRQTAHDLHAVSKSNGGGGGMPLSARKAWAIAGLPGSTADKLTQPYKQHAWTYAAISKYADFIKALPWRLKQGRTTEDAREIEDGPWYDVINRPNELWSGSDLKEATTIWLLINGNAMWLLDRESYEQEPEEIWCLPHTHFDPVYIPGTWNVSHWMMRSLDGAKRTPVAPWQVCFFRLFGPYNLIFGQSPLEAAGKSLSQDWNAIIFNEKFFEQGCVPGGILTTTKDMGPKQREQAEAWFREKYRGLKRTFETIITDEGIADYKPLAVSHMDMHFEGLRHMNREEIAGILKVPPSIMGWKDEVHKATQEKELRDWISGPVRGLCSVMDESTRSQIWIPYRDEFFWLEYDFTDVAALQEDEGERVNRANTMFAWGVPVEELNRRFNLGLEEYDGWDQSLLPVSLLPRGEGFPLGGAASEEPESKTPSKTYSFLVSPTHDQRPMNAGTTTTPPRLLSSPGAEVEVKAELRPHTAGEIVLWNDWISKTAPMEAAFSGQITNYLLKAQRWLSRNLSSAAGPEDMLADILGEVPHDWLTLPDSFDMQLRSVARRMYRKIAKEVAPTIEAHIQAAKIPYNFDINHFRITSFMQTKEVKVVLHVNHEFLREKVREAVEEALRREATIGQLQDVLFGKFNKAGVREGGLVGTRNLYSRALRIARTETAQCANGLEFESERIAGVKEHQWLASRDMHVRESHLANMALGPYPVTAVFPNGCKYPGDMNALPGETINCRCSLIPVS